MIFTTNNEKETVELGKLFGSLLQPGDVVALYGYLGAGKTAFVSGVARGMGLNAKVSSPTFTIVNEYPGKIPLFHFDMYRLGSSDELFEIGWEDYLDRSGVCIVEWSENVTDAFPSDTIRVEIDKTGENERKITITSPKELAL